MSDQPKNKGIPAILRQMTMLSLVAGTSALGASFAMYLQSDKTPAAEEKHSNAGEDSHSESKISQADHHRNDDEVTGDSDETSEHVVDDAHANSLQDQARATRSKKSMVRSEENRNSGASFVFSSADEVSEDNPFDTYISQGRKSYRASRSKSAQPSQAVDGDHQSQDDPFSMESLGFSDSAEDVAGEHGLGSKASEIHDGGRTGADSDHTPLSHSVQKTHSVGGHGHEAKDSEIPKIPELDAITLDEEHQPTEHGSDSRGGAETEHDTVDPAASNREFAASEANAYLAPSRHERVTKQAVNLMAVADEELAGGDYVQAMQHYQTLRQKSDGVPAVAILFRLALCAEASGRYSAAIEAYRRISGTQSDPAWAGVARYGEARCLSVLKKHQGLQTDLLRRAILDETEFLPTVRGEVLHLIGRDLWREQSQTAIPNLLDDQTLIVPEWVADPGRLLDELPMLVHETPVKSGKTEFRVLNMKPESPEETIVRLNCGSTKCEKLLRDLVQCCEYEIDVSELASQALKGRTQQVHVTEQNLALLLDGITISAGAAWTQAGSVISILHPEEMSPEEIRQCRLGAAERILRTAIMEIPGSRQTGHSRLALSTLLFQQKRATDALQFLQVQMESPSRSIVETEAAFNLGKCLMLLNQRDEAIEAFLRSIDSSGGMADVRIAAYIFHSRMLLEDGHGKQAIQSMMRGLSIGDGSPLESLAAIHLASLYLSVGNAKGCNSVLMDRRESLNEGLGREGAAFLSALSRFQAAVLADRREREGAAVVSALTEFDATNYCGGHWAVLVASACEELGLSQESAEAYSLALRKLPHSQLRNETVLKLASHYKAENQPEKAQVLLATLSSSESNHLAVQARLRTAELAMERRKPDEAIAICRGLLESDRTPGTQRASLRIMGQAYELKKDYRAAIYCFAGQLPDGDLQPEPDPHHHNSKTTGGHD